jgi:hypothetical protein
MGALGPGTREDKYWTLAVLTWEDLQRILRDNTMEVRRRRWSCVRVSFLLFLFSSFAFLTATQELARKEEMQQRYSVFKRQARLLLCVT